MIPDPHDPSDKRPKLERARSAAEKENQPLQRSGSQLRRQYSQQETPRRMSSSDGGMDIMGGPQQRRMQNQQFQQQQQMQPTYPQQQAQYHHSAQSQQQNIVSGGVGMLHGQNITAQHSNIYGTEDPKFYQVNPKSNYIF